MKNKSSERENKINQPQGYVIFFEKKRPVIWERETERYVFKVKLLNKEEETWVVNKKIFDEKMDKSEIYLFNGNTYR